MLDFHDCPYCAEELEQWSVRFQRGDDAGGEGLTLLSLCPTARCGYHALRYRNGLSHWDRDVEAARVLRTLFGD